MATSFQQQQQKGCTSDRQVESKWLWQIMLVRQQPSDGQATAA